MPSIHHRHYQASRVSRNRYANPYFRSRSADRLGRSRTKAILAKIPPRAWFYFFLACVIVGSLIWLFAFSAVLAIATVRVEGTVNYDTREIETAVWDQAEASRGFIFSQSRLAVFDSDQLRKTLSERYSFENLRITKKLPRTLLIRIQETAPAAVWFEADQYYLVSADGVILKTIVSPDPELPAVYNNGLPRLENNRLNGQEAALKTAAVLQQELKGRLSYFPYEQLVVDNDRDTIKIIGKKAPVVYLTTDDHVPAELERLDTLLKGELGSQLGKLHYIDLRFGDKVYYK